MDSENSVNLMNNGGRLSFFRKCGRFPFLRKLGTVTLVCGTLAVCLSYLEAACHTCLGDKHLNDEYLASPGVNPFAGDKGDMPVSGTIDQIATEFIGEKGKTYMFSLGFRPTTQNIFEFEQILRNDFDGEIEIYTDGKPYKTMRYKDFDSFAWHPGKDLYGPVYNFKIEYGAYTTSYSFRPKIRSDKPYTYSFYIQRIRKSFVERLSNLFNSKTHDEKRQHTDDTKHSVAGKELNIPATIERVDINIEKKGVYVMRVGLPWPTDDVVASYNDPWIYKNFDGDVDVYQNSNEYLVVPYDNIENDGTKYIRYITSLSLFCGNHMSMPQSFFIDKPGIYSFIPKIRSKNEFEFSFSIHRSIWRK